MRGPKWNHAEKRIAPFAATQTFNTFSKEEVGVAFLPKGIKLPWKR